MLSHQQQTKPVRWSRDVKDFLALSNDGRGSGRESQDGSLLPKPGDYQAMNTAEKAGAGPATSWAAIPIPQGGARGGGGGGGLEVKYIKSRFCQVSKYA